MFCKRCGQQIDDNAQFCTNCGAPASVHGAGPQNQYNNRYNSRGQYNNQGYQGNPGYQYSNSGGAPMKKGYAIAAYITWIGFFIALFAGDRYDPFTRFHLNQALVLNVFSIIASVVSYITIIGAVIGWIASVFISICWIIGLVGACQGRYKEVPVFGKIHWIK